MGGQISIGKPDDLETMKKYQGMTINHIMLIKERLDLLSDEDLSINKPSFQLCFKSKEAETDRLFNLFDLSNDDKIQILEFICALALISHASLKEKCQFIFGLYDFDKNRTMTKNELIILIKTMLTSMNIMTCKGECTIQEAEVMAELILKRYATNKDANISMQEFQSFVSKDPDILKMLLSYGLISTEDLRFNFGQMNQEIRDADSDLENEIYKSKIRTTEKFEQISLGVEHSFVTNQTTVTHQNKDEQQIDNIDQKWKEKMSSFDWKKQVKECAPSDNKQQSYDSNAPAASLEIFHVYGFKSFDTRNNLKYSSTNELVYNTGAIGICLNSDTNQQRFFMEHTADITCLDIGEKYAITGQMGRYPTLFVWDTTTMETIAVLKGLFMIGISNISISNDQKKIVAIGMDDDQCIGIYDLEKAITIRLNGKRDDSLIASGKGPRNEIFDIKFDKTDKTIVIACKFEVNFVTFDNQSIKVMKGGWEQKICPLQSILSVGILDNSAVTGTFKGQIILWRGNRTTQAYEAHQGPVMAIHTRKQEVGVITAGKDGFIIFWDSNVKQKKRISLASYPELLLSSTKITAICENSEGTQYAIGTRGGEIIEFTNDKPKKSMTGHYQGNLKGLCCHPQEQTFYTVGEDNLLMKWDAISKKQINFIKLEYQSKTIDISNDAKYLAIGCHNGNILIVDPNTFVQQLDFKDRDSEITTVKFSPDNEFLLCAYSQPYCEIFIYKCSQNFKKVSIVNGFKDAIMSIDFGNDNKDNQRIIMVTDRSQSLRYIDISVEASPVFIPRGEYVYRDTQWSTYTSMFGWHVMGIWPEVAQGNDINAVDKAINCNVLVTADDYSGLKLFRFPANDSKQSYNRFSGHSGQVSNVRFTYKNEYVISLGGKEKSIIQWKFTNEQDLQDDYEIVKPSLKGKKTQIIDQVVDDEDQIAQQQSFKQNTQNKPYLQQLKGMSPEDKVQQESLDNILPQEYLSMQYVFGMRNNFAGNDIFNVLRYSSTGKIVYPAAGLVIIQDPKPDLKTNIRQTYFNRHSQDVISLAIHPKGLVVASGTAAQNYSDQLVEIMLWNVETKSLICFIQDFHIRGISHLAFSPDGTLLLTIGMDDDHSLALYDWQANRLLSTSKIEKSQVYDIGWRNNLQFFSTGQMHLKFWTIMGRNLKAQYGNFKENIFDPVKSKQKLTSKETFEPQTAIAMAFGLECVSGSILGNLFLWKGNRVAQRIKGHEGQVNILLNARQNLYSAGQDGKVMVWNLNLNQICLTTIIIYPNSITTIPNKISSITSIDWKNESFAIITKEGELWEIISPQRSQLISQSHHSGQVSGLTNSPDGLMFLTAGADKMLRLWDLNKKRQMNFHSFDFEVMVVDWSEDGSLIIVGDAGGVIYLLDAKLQLKEKKSTKFKSMKSNKNNGSFKISDIKFSPDCNKVALGGQGGPSHIEVWEIENGKFLEQSMVINIGFTGSLTHLDWSKNSQFMMATSESYELKFISYQKQQDVPVNQVKDVEWSTWSCVYGYQVQGIYPYSIGKDIAAVQRSKNQEFIITGDDFGIIRLFHYPATYNKPIQLHRRFSGHQGNISQIRILQDDKIIISAGSQDRTLIIWSIDQDVVVPILKLEDPNKQGEIENQLKTLQIAHAEEKKIGVQKFGIVKVKKDQYTQNSLIQSSDEDEEDAKTSNYIYMKPWVGSVREPTGYYKDPLNQSKAPMIDIELDYVHGYRSYDSRNNVKYLKNGSIVYHTAGLGVVMDVVNNIQKFFNHHLNDIISLDLHNDGIRVATGEIGQSPIIYVWDSNTLLPLCKFQGSLTQGICSLHFSPFGDRLCAAAIDDQHEVAIFETNTKSLHGGSFLTKEPSGNNLIMEIKWRSDNELISIGPFHFKKWSLSSSGLISQTINSQIGQSSIYITCVVDNKDIYIGDATGQLQIWKDFTFQESIALHDGQQLEALYIGKEFLLTGGRDQKVNIYELKSQIKGIPLLSLKLQDIIKNSTLPEVRSVQMSPDYRNILIGTYGGEIWELSTKDIKINQASRFGQSKPIIKSHYCTQRNKSNQIWGLAFNPVDVDVYYTCGDDATLRVWSIQQKKMMSQFPTNLDTNQNEFKLNEKGEMLDSVKGRSIVVTPDGQQVIVGFKDGTLRVFDKDYKQKSIMEVAKDWISCMKFSPDGSILAIGSHDNSVYLYNYPEMKPHNKPLRKHSDFIQNIDFSCDGKKIHTTCGGFDLIFWNVETNKQLTSGPMLLRDEKWSTWTSLLGWPVQGIWSDTSDGTDINCCDRSNQNYSGKDQPPDNYFLLAVGNDYNEVKVHRYPCVQRSSSAIIGRGHSSPVQQIKFSPDDQYLISVGGEDMTIMQWKIIKK